MIRLWLVVVAGGTALSYFAFNQGGVLPGSIFALAALAAVAWGIAGIMRKRSGAGPLGAPAKRAVLAAVLVLVVGVGYSAYWMLREPKASKKPLTYTHSLSKLCDTPPTYFPDAAAFGGGKPHPVAIFAKTDDLGFDLVRDESSSAPSLEGREVQLVVCLDEVESGPFIVKCTFSDGSVPMYQGRFKGTVREARTGRKVGSVAVDGVTTASACPRVATTKGDEPRLHSAPTVEVVRAAMGSILD